MERSAAAKQPAAAPVLPFRSRRLNSFASKLLWSEDHSEMRLYIYATKGMPFHTQLGSLNLEELNTKS
jgi:hypothetical protein